MHKKDTSEKIDYAARTCRWGNALVARSSAGICAVLLGDAVAPLVKDLKSRFPAAVITQLTGGAEDFAADVIATLDNPRRRPRLKLDMRGTAFQQNVWAALRDIPAGQTASYTEIARRIGKPRAVRAVAGACAANALAVLVPCHRVITADGKISGYRWGVARKRKLLELEGAFPRPPAA